ncbi:putative reverse transcriptase domain-containing protein, partial [Tanacetum coccineum]
ETDIQEKDKKKAKNKQNQARNGKDKVKSKLKSVKVKSQPITLWGAPVLFKRKEKLFAEFFKYEFWLQELCFLRHVVNSNDIYVDSSYSRRFIANSSKVAKPLASLTQKIRKYEWAKEQEEAFQTLKDNLCDAPILSLPDGSKEFVVYYDASNQGLGCVLMKRGKVENATAEMLRGLDQLMERKEDGGMKFIWVPLIYDVRTLIMDEAHASRRCMEGSVGHILFGLKLKKFGRLDQNWYKRQQIRVEVGDKVMLELLSWKDVVHFGKKEMLAPRYVGSFEIIKGIGPMAY